jgi:GNAT superfamily N-acetyltransferase
MRLSNLDPVDATDLDLIPTPGTKFVTLDNPIWNALLTDHNALALWEGPARRYPADIGPLSGVPDQSSASYEALRTLAGPGDVLALFLQEPPVPPPGWTLQRGGLIRQMVCTTPKNEQPPALAEGASLRRLAAEDVPAMLALAELTEPGPFRTRTIELGNFFGIFDAGQLVAMAGQRLSLPGFTEVSAVCTHPDARGRGYSRALMSVVIEDIVGQEKVPFLHVFADNHSAIRIYESIGFTQRRTFHLAVVKNEG